jgi:hypothetical protein
MNVWGAQTYRGIIAPHSAANHVVSKKVNVINHSFKQANEFVGGSDL